MYDMMDAEYFVACLYFIVIVIVMNFWLLNLFVAVINEMFAKIREDTQHSAFTTSKYGRKEWIECELTMDHHYSTFLFVIK
jgi:hypothetical protein